jgi:hypothetical protein
MFDNLGKHWTSAAIEDHHVDPSRKVAAYQHH